MENSSQSSVSYWSGSSPQDYLSPTPLSHGELADVCVVGGGIAGLTTAYLLLEEGRSVVVLDDGPFGGGMTGYTSAHLSNALDDRYYWLERRHGEEGARLAAQSHTAAIDKIAAIVEKERIRCDFVRVDGFLVESLDGPGRELEKEHPAARRAGLPVEWADSVPWPEFPSGRCLRFPDQAQFHPLRYINGLAKAIQKKGGRLYSHTKAVSVQGGARAWVDTESGHRVVASHIVVATNTPFNNRVVIHTKQAPYNTYIVGLAIPRGLLQPALCWDTQEAYHYVRLTSMDETDDLLIVGGEDHKTGQAEDFEARYHRLEQWARERFPSAGRVLYRWSGEVFEPLDGMAYIGRNPGDEENVYLCTGDSGNGLTHGTLGAMLLTDLICGRENPWESLYNPSRVPLGTATEFLKENLNVAVQYTDWVTPGEVACAEDLSPGEGGVVRRGLRKVACYRDEEGQLHEFSAVCPHLAGIVAWNGSEQTWDCPCHGSRFDRFGKVFVGPANSDLAPLDEAGVTPLMVRPSGA
jgi:glycine/D-amino acid oxidase-like deaminating enzyme/nitrite reductase/ring-hydroxylating ferredoxin subunit